MADSAPQNNPLPLLIRLSDVMRLCGLGKSAIYARVKSGEFPKPVQLTVHAVAWVRSEVEEWCAKRIAARDSQAVS